MPKLATAHAVSPKPAKAAKRTRAASRWRNERQFMAAVISQCDGLAKYIPAYADVYHVSNENAHRQPGVRAGVPDLQLDEGRYDPVAACTYHGWRCELKILGGNLSDAQESRIAKLKANGYYVSVVWESVRDVMDSLEWYLGLPRA